MFLQFQLERMHRVFAPWFCCFLSATIFSWGNIRERIKKFHRIKTNNCHHFLQLSSSFSPPCLCVCAVHSDINNKKTKSNYAKLNHRIFNQDFDMPRQNGGIIEFFFTTELSKREMVWKVER